MSISSEKLIGIINSSRPNNFEKKWTDLTTDMQQFHFVKTLMGNMRKDVSGGDGVEFNVVYGTGNNAENVGLFDTASPSQQDFIAKGKVPFRFTRVSYSLDERERQLNTNDASRIIDLIDERRLCAQQNMAELIENNFWSKPATSADESTPFGLFYWLVKTSGKTAIADCGFNGGDPDGFADGAAGISTSTIPRWKNWAGNYAAVTKADLVLKMRKAHEETFFVSPIKAPTYESNSIENRYQIFCNYSTKSSLENIGEAQNENLGRDIASMDGSIVFRKNPIMWIPQLDSDTSNPVYFVNWDVIKAMCLKGEFFKEVPMKSATQPRVVSVFTYLSWNTICYNRRRLAVLSV